MLSCHRDYLHPDDGDHIDRISRKKAGFIQITGNNRGKPCTFFFRIDEKSCNPKPDHAPVLDSRSQGGPVPVSLPGMSTSKQTRELFRSISISLPSRVPWKNRYPSLYPKQTRIFVHNPLPAETYYQENTPMAAEASAAVGVALDPRFGKNAIFNSGFEGRVLIKFIF